MELTYLVIQFNMVDSNQSQQVGWDSDSADILVLSVEV